MRIHLDSIRGCRDFEHKAKACLYRNCPSEGVSARLAGLPVGIVSGVLTVAARVATTGEAVLKGALNIIGSFWRDDCSWRRGLKQLFFSATKSFVIIPFSPLKALVGVANTTLFMVLIPEDLVNERIIRHNPLEYYEGKVNKIFASLSSRISFRKNNPIAVTSYMLYARPHLSYYYRKIAEIERSTPLLSEIYREIAKVYSEMPLFPTKRFQDYKTGIYFENKRIGSNIENQESVLKALVKLESLYTQLNLAKFQANPDEYIIDQEITRPSEGVINASKKAADAFYQDRANEEKVEALLQALPELVRLRSTYDSLNILRGRLLDIRRCADSLASKLGDSLIKK